MNTDPSTDWNLLHEPFRTKLRALFIDLAGHGLHLDLVEGFRHVERQQYLYAQGRTRPGPVVTYKDGVNNKSNHQSGNAADVYFLDGTHRYLPPIGSPEWVPFLSSCQAHGLTWGGLWKMQDTPHVELHT